MKKIAASIIILLLFCLFAVFDYTRRLEKTVLNFKEPAILEIDLNNNKIIDKDETICIPDTETFTSNLSSDKSVLAGKLNISKKDALAIGYLADEFA